jgi:hypothetical protein
LENVRASFLHVFKMQEPQRGTDGRAAFAAHFLFAPDSPQVKAKWSPEIKTVTRTASDGTERIYVVGATNHERVAKAMRAAAEAKWGKKGAEMLAALIDKDQVCLHNGVEKSIKYPEYAGMLYVSARSQVRPAVFDGQKRPLTEADGKPYSGCYVNGVVDVYASVIGKNWVTAQLQGVQFYSDGDSFGGGRPADADDFDNVADTGDGEAAWEESEESAAASLI